MDIEVNEFALEESLAKVERARTWSPEGRLEAGALHPHGR